MTRRRTSYLIRCAQMAGVTAVLVVPAIVLHALAAWIFGIR